MDVFAIILNLIIAVLLVIHYIWVDKRIKNISSFIDQFKNASEGFEKFFRTYSQMLSDLEKDNQRLKTKYNALTVQYDEVAKMLGTIDSDKVPKKLKNLLGLFDKVLEKTDILIKGRDTHITTQDQHIKKLEDELSNYRVMQHVLSRSYTKKGKLGIFGRKPRNIATEYKASKESPSSEDKKEEK